MPLNPRSSRRVDEAAFLPQGRHKPCLSLVVPTRADPKPDSARRAAQRSPSTATEGAVAPLRPSFRLGGSSPRSSATSGTPLAPEHVLQAVEPADVTAALVRGKRRGFDLLLGKCEARLQRVTFPLGRAVPGKQGTGLSRGEPAAWQLPAVQVLLKLFVGVIRGLAIGSGGVGSACAQRRAASGDCRQSLASYPRRPNGPQSAQGHPADSFPPAARTKRGNAPLDLCVVRRAPGIPVATRIEGFRYLARRPQLLHDHEPARRLQHPTKTRTDDLVTRAAEE